jgi:hypothetical protein
MRHVPGDRHACQGYDDSPGSLFWFGIWRAGMNPSDYTHSGLAPLRLPRTSFSGTFRPHPFQRVRLGPS